MVIPALKVADLQRFATGDLTLDHLMTWYIHGFLSYQDRVVDSSRKAYELERQVRDGALLRKKPRLSLL